ncbi:hypothetical protein GH714_016428 [Hevea brasiliensis]|uniref:Uncharacterized protein n=1 Tax=Hevea brasiliensis TaxID=3981 RepID=A0A6A6NHR8_HEVBR|nr:hypothetical protein GH714_016428 [Hevea brasiliensis]
MALFYAATFRDADTAMDDVEFVLQNFTEMNKLWVQMQYQLRSSIGLSGLQGPGQVNCKDEIAQYYLMDCIIQVFPDEYHLLTLDALLGACPQLQLTVDVKTVLSQLMERLSNYAASIEDMSHFYATLTSYLYESSLDM